MIYVVENGGRAIVKIIFLSSLHRIPTQYLIFYAYIFDAQILWEFLYSLPNYLRFNAFIDKQNG